MTHKENLFDRATGCLLAGAAGDALGAAVEFIDRPEILRRFGAGGIRDYAPAYGGIGTITDDTQMTLFTAEGCLRALQHARAHGDTDDAAIIRDAYLRWLSTQAATATAVPESDSWLLRQPALFARRAPGHTCLSALSRKGAEKNNSKGCGGIMRVAPCGILHAGQPAAAFSLGSRAAKLTHGHPTGYLSAGVFAAIIAELMAGKILSQAIGAARDILLGLADHEETLHALDLAMAMASHGEPAQTAIPRLGEGWIAEEALAIAVYCALHAPNLEEGIVSAVNITGDSDSTGAIAGNLLGAMLGASAIPPRWLIQLELREVIETIARDLILAQGSDQPVASGDWTGRYPAT